MKTSRITKKTIQEILRTSDLTKIYSVAKKSGVDISNKMNLFRFIEKYAPTKKIYDNAYQLVFVNKKFFDRPSKESKILRAIKYAKFQKSQGKTNYSKVLIIGNSNIYWASPAFEHQDYNKSVAFANCEKNREIAEKINKYLKFN